MLRGPPGNCLRSRHRQNPLLCKRCCGPCALRLRHWPRAMLVGVGSLPRARSRQVCSPGLLCKSINRFRHQHPRPWRSPATVSTQRRSQLRSRRRVQRSHKSQRQKNRHHAAKFLLQASMLLASFLAPKRNLRRKKGQGRRPNHPRSRLTLHWIQVPRRWEASWRRRNKAVSPLRPCREATYRAWIGLLRPLHRPLRQNAPCHPQRRRPFRKQKRSCGNR